MKVKIWELATESEVDAWIRIGNENEMPSMHENWRFNFNRHIKQANCIGYVLTAADTPGIIEGCMILRMKAESVLYLSYLEVAPQNQKPDKKYDRVAGCLTKKYSDTIMAIVDEDGDELIKKYLDNE